MRKNNDAGKIALIALGSLAAAAGIAALVYYNDDARARVEGIINRERAKFFVKHNLGGNDALVNAVDHLSDSEVNTIMKLAGSSKSAVDTVKDKTTDAFDTIMDRARGVSSDVSGAVKDYFN